MAIKLDHCVCYYKLLFYFHGLNSGSSGLVPKCLLKIELLANMTCSDHLKTRPKSGQWGSISSLVAEMNLSVCFLCRGISWISEAGLNFCQILNQTSLWIPYGLGTDWVTKI